MGDPLPLAAYPSLFHPGPVVDPAWQRAARWLLTGCAYLALVVGLLLLVGLVLSSAKVEAGISALMGVLVLVVAGTVVAALLALVVRLRPRSLGSPAEAADDIFVLYGWGVPGVITLPLTVTGQVTTALAAVGSSLWFFAQLAGKSPWLTVPSGVIWLAAIAIGGTLLTDRLLLALRRRLASRYPARPLLVAGHAGIAAANWGPIAWAAVSDARLQWFTAGKNRFLMLAVDTVAPPGPDEPRAKWAYRYLHGDAFVVDLRRALIDKHAALAAIRARRPAA